MTPKPRRRWFSLSIRGLLTVILLLAGCLGWIVHRARVQSEAVAAIVRSGGRVMYEWERKEGNTIPDGKPWWPKWLVDLIGVDFFGNVVMAELSRKGSDAEMIHIAKLHQLEERYLYVSNGNNDPDTRLTDAGMAHVSGLTRLRTMTLSSNRVGDVGLEHLKGLASLKELTILMTRATTDGIVRLQKSLPNLRLTWFGCTSPDKIKEHPLIQWLRGLMDVSHPPPDEP